MVFGLRFLPACCILLQCFAAAFGQSASSVPPDITRDVTLTVSTADGRSSFRMGELIPLKLAFNSALHGKYQVDLATYDRSGRMMEESFLIRPESGWVDPLKVWFGSGGIMGGLRGIGVLSGEPIFVALDLNEWVRFDRPGKYKVRVRSGRVNAIGGTPGVQAPDVVSNEIELRIVPADNAWQRETLRKAFAALDKPADPKVNPATQDDRKLAARTLRFLGSAEATKELARRCDGEDNAEFDYMLGLAGSPHRDVAISELNRLLSDPDHGVSMSFVYGLAHLMRDPEGTPEQWMKEDANNYKALEAELMNAVLKKRGRAQALSLNTLMEAGSHGAGSTPLSAKHAAVVAASFDQLPLEKQKEVLEYRWDLIKGPAMLPVVRRYAQKFRDLPISNENNTWNALHLSGAALRDWYELEPEAARAVILEEIARPAPRFGSEVLGILPDKTLPEADQLAGRLAEEKNLIVEKNIASLLERYATDAALAQALAVTDEHVGKWACDIQSPVLAWLVRINPEAARPRVEAAMAARGANYSACNHNLLTEAGKLYPHPLLEEIALRSLDDEDPQVAGNAAAYLGKYGSAQAEPKLWEHLVRWNEKWRGREAEFHVTSGADMENYWQSELGANLMWALAGGYSWFADSSKLERLRQLAVGEQMTQQVESAISEWNQRPWGISYNSFPGDQRFSVLHYETDSLSRFKEKLAQFPSGTIFVWNDFSSPAEKMFHELSEFLAGQNMTLAHRGETIPVAGGDGRK